MRSALEKETKPHHNLNKTYLIMPLKHLQLCGATQQKLSFLSLSLSLQCVFIFSASIFENISVHENWQK